MVSNDYTRSVRFLFFQTNFEDFPYASYVATAFVVSFEGRYFVLTCEHNEQDFSWHDVVITDSRFGQNAAGIKAIYKPDRPSGYAVGSDILDVRVIELDDDASASFFCDNAYILCPETICQSNEKDVLELNGALKELSEIQRNDLSPTFARLEFMDFGRHTHDIVLRNGKAKCGEDWPIKLSGISGSPVFNKTQKKLCGMTMRAGREGDDANMWYVEIGDILQILTGVQAGKLEVLYQKL